MSALLLTPPAVEPVSLDEARAFLRVQQADEDELIAALMAGARIHIESETRRALITQSWRLSMDCWPADGRVPVVPGPLQQLDAARIYDFAGVAHAVDLSHFVPDQAASILAFPPWAVPVPSRIANGVELDVTVGYGDTPLDVPEALRQAIRILIAHWYDNRGLTTIGHEVAQLPETAAALMAPYRMLSL